MTFYNGSAREIRGRAQSSSRNIWHEQPVRHALLEMPDHRGIETASASPLAVLKLDDSGVYVSTRKGKRVLLCSCRAFSIPMRRSLDSKKSPGFLRGRGSIVGQRETLALSGLTRNVAFGPRGFVLPFQISRLVWPAYYIPSGKLPVCFDDL